MPIVPEDPFLDPEAAGKKPLEEDPDRLVWAGLGSPSRVALRYAVRFPGRKPFDSDLVCLRALERAGFVYAKSVHGREVYFATLRGQRVHDAGQRDA